MNNANRERPDEDFQAIVLEQARIEAESGRFVGLSLGEAKSLATELGMLLRIIEVDADAWHTPDFRRNGLTADVKDGHVISATVG